MLSHVEAAEVVRQAFQAVHGRLPSLAERQGIQAVSHHEGSYGAGWSGAGVGSRNWGAVQEGLPPCSDHAFEYGDTKPNPDGTSTGYRACFRIYASDVDGAADVVKLVTTRRPVTWAAMQRGDLLGMASNMYDTVYYQEKGPTRASRIDKYVSALSASLAAIAKANGEPIALTIIPPASSAAKASSMFLGVALGALAGHWAYAVWRQDRGT